MKPQMTATKFKNGTVYVCCGNKEFLAFAIWNDGRRGEIIDLVMFEDAMSYVEDFFKVDPLYEAFKKRIPRVVSSEPFRVPMRLQK
jgi:hypothetical protein